MKTALLSMAVVAAAAVPGVASAATISVDETGTVQYQAAPGEANKLDLTWPVSPYTFVDGGATLHAGDGCTLIEAAASCAGRDIDVALRDRDDRARVNSFSVGDVTLDAGTGNDDVLVGSNANATAAGGTGDDTLVLFANAAGYGDGGAGNDQLAGRSTGGDLLQGGTGNDLLVRQPGSGRQVGSLSGGGGNDRLVSTGAGTATDGGDGNDLLLDGKAIAGGAGNDVISSTSGGATIDGGTGNDVIVAMADGTAADTIVCGAGFDLVWADGTDTVSDDCETRFDEGPAPTLPGQTRAQADATALLAHKPDVS